MTLQLLTKFARGEVVFCVVEGIPGGEGRLPNWGGITSMALTSQGLVPGFGGQNLDFFDVPADS